MKKIFTFLVLFGIALSLFGQPPTTSSSLTVDETWTTAMSPIHITGDVTVPNGITLTINSGVTIMFDTGKSLIIIGALKANGISGTGNKVTFTAWSSSWGHIYFNNSTGSSNLDYCLIEKGNATGLTPQYGGGLLISTNNLSISNCQISNNSAGWGGGILLYSNSNTTISNCLIKNNSTIHEGAGIYISTVTHALITNCIFESNTASGTGGGVFIGTTASDTKIINCTIVKNNALSGANILLTVNTNSTRPFFKNCIIWGKVNSIVYHQQTPQSSDFVNCAIQTPVSGSTTNCITLNATNTNAAGPNFVATDGTNWLIQPWSPCVDIGIDNSSDPNVPLTDYVGNTRVGQTDAGVYENQFFRWQGDDLSSPTLWNISENWNAGSVPSGNESIFIPSGKTNYPIGSTTQDYTIGAGKYLIIESRARLTLNNLTNNGTLKLNSSSSGNASLILTTYTKGGGATEEIQLFLTGGGTKTPLTYKWHYISSPVTSLAVSTFAPAYTLNVAQWVQDRPSTSLTQGWVAYDGYIYSTGGSTEPTFSSFTPGKGYDYFKTTDYTYTFGGQLNTGDVNASLSYKVGNDNLYGYNLIGNPFPSGLDWDYIITHSFPTNTTKSLYFTKNSTLCTYINGVGLPLSENVNGIIPPMQGFFSKTYSAGNTIVLAAAARTHNDIHATYKGSKSLIPLVRLALADSLLTDETVVRFDDLAKSYLDNDFDAVKMFLDPSLSSIHTSLDGTDYAINGLPFPETLLEIPVTVNIATGEETKSITASQLQGLDNYTVTLTDNSTGFVADLRTTPTVTFAAAKGSVAGRFILKISAVTTGVESPVVTNNKFNIYPANNSINIQTVADEWEGKSGTVRLMDLTGKTLSNLHNTEFHKNSLTQVASPAAKGIYVVEIRAGNMRYVGKVVIH